MYLLHSRASFLQVRQQLREDVDHVVDVNTDAVSYTLASLNARKPWIPSVTFVFMNRQLRILGLVKLNSAAS